MSSGSKGKPIPISNAEASQISERVLQGVEKPRPSVVVALQLT